MAETFNTGQEVSLQIPSVCGVMQVKEGTCGSKREVRRSKLRSPVPINYLTYLHEILEPPIEAAIRRDELRQPTLFNVAAQSGSSNHAAC